MPTTDLVVSFLNVHHRLILTERWNLPTAAIIQPKSLEHHNPRLSSGLKCFYHRELVSKIVEVALWGDYQ
jgi:hypothetical protein